jgi:quercetin dioxygenase-like cupin family protein
MSATEQGTWMTGWTAEDPVRIGYAWTPKDGGTWEPNADDGFEHRDLGVGAASSGALGVHHVRRPSAGAAPDEAWRVHDVDFDFLYVLEGSVRLADEDGTDTVLERGTTITIPPRARHRLTELSADFEAIHITSPASFTTAADADALPSRPPAAEAARAPVISRDVPENYAKGAGPREFFLYRDLGTRGPTEERIHIHVVRATEPGAGTGWHYHTMAQWFLIVGGTSNIGVEDHALQPLQVGDAMCVGFGPQMRHNVAPFSGDYAVLEMCVPAQYETIATDPPEGAAA